MKRDRKKCKFNVLAYKHTLTTLLQFTKRVENNIYSKVWRTGARLVTCVFHGLLSSEYFLDKKNKFDIYNVVKSIAKYFFSFSSMIFQMKSGPSMSGPHACRMLFPPIFC